MFMMCNNSYLLVSIISLSSYLFAERKSLRNWYCYLETVLKNPKNKNSIKNKYDLVCIHPKYQIE